MLERLSVRNFVLIDQLDLELKKGLNIITGETGAGKSIILDALNLLLGARSDSHLVGPRDSSATVVGEFVDHSGQSFIVKRSISKEGKSKITVDGMPASLQELRQKVEPLVDVTSQHENSRLLRKEHQLDIVDRFAGLGGDILEYTKFFHAYSANESELKELEIKGESWKSRKDYVEFQIEEFRRINPQPGEDALIEDQIKNIQKSQQAISLQQGIENVFDGVEGGLFQKLNELKQLVKSLGNSPKINEALAIAHESIAELQKNIINELKSPDIENSSLEDLEQRRDDLFRLISKHGRTMEKSLETWEAFEKEMSEANQIETLIEKSTKLRDEALKKANKLAAGLHEKRKQAAKDLSKQISKELHELEMPDANFSVELSQASQLNAKGHTDVTFLFSANPNMELRGIAKVASGGELSRVLLAVKQVTTHQDYMSVYIFDEVDAGIGGRTATTVGRKLWQVASSAQVICITHLPQVAAYADHHFSVSKKKGLSSIEVITEEERISEIARMLGGKVQDKTILQSAKVLIQTSASEKGTNSARPRKTATKTGSSSALAGNPGLR